MRVVKAVIICLLFVPIVSLSPVKAQSQQSVIPNPAPWFWELPDNLHNFLEQLYLTVYFFQLPSNMAYLLEGIFATTTPTPALGWHTPTPAPSGWSSSPTPTGFQIVSPTPFTPTLTNPLTIPQQSQVDLIPFLYPALSQSLQQSSQTNPPPLNSFLSAQTANGVTLSVPTWITDVTGSHGSVTSNIYVPYGDYEFETAFTWPSNGLILNFDILTGDIEQTGGLKRYWFGLYQHPQGPPVTLGPTPTPGGYSMNDRGYYTYIREQNGQTVRTQKLITGFPLLTTATNQLIYVKLTKIGAQYKAYLTLNPANWGTPIADQMTTLTTAELAIKPLNIRMSASSFNEQFYGTVPRTINYMKLRRL